MTDESDDVVQDVIANIKSACIILIGRAGTGKSTIATNVVINMCDKASHRDAAVSRVFVVTSAYQQGLALKERLAQAVPDDVDVIATSLHAFMGVRPIFDGDLEKMPKEVRGMTMANRLDTLLAVASYRQLNEGDGVQLVILEEFFYSHLAAHVLLYLATRPRTYVIVCGDPGQIGRDVYLPDGTACHVSQYIYDYVIVPHISRRAIMIALTNASYRQSSIVLRRLAEYMEKHNKLPLELQHTFNDYVREVIPDATIIQRLVEWHNTNTPCYLVSSRAFVNQASSSFIEITEAASAIRCMAGSRAVWLSRRTDWYETAAAISYTIEGEKTPRYVPNGTPVTIESANNNKVMVRVDGVDFPISVSFSSIVKDDPVRPIRFKSYDLIQGETIDFNILFHSTGSMSPGAIYVAMTRVIDVSLFYCSISFKKMIIEYAQSQEIINHPHANRLYDNMAS